MLEEFDPETTPCEEWDWDESDLLCKLESYLYDISHRRITDSNSKESYNKCLLIIKDKCQHYNPIGLSSINVINTLIAYAKNLHKQELGKFVSEITDITYSWCEEDNCFYEED